MITVEQTRLSGVKIISTKRFADDRGFFSESYNEHHFENAGIVDRFVQDNHSLSIQKGTVRGLHYQAPPHAQTKLVRVIRGSVIDIAVDIRQGSPTFKDHIAIELSAENGKQLLVPEGFLHGFATLSDNTEVVYKVTDFYSGAHDGSVRWNSPELGLDWGINTAAAVLSAKDSEAVLWKDFETPFTFET